MMLAANAAASVRGESVSAPASALHQARRDIAFTPDAEFDLLTAEMLSSRHPSTSAPVLVFSVWG